MVVINSFNTKIHNVFTNLGHFWPQFQNSSGPYYRAVMAFLVRHKQPTAWDKVGFFSGYQRPIVWGKSGLSSRDTSSPPFGTKWAFFQETSGPVWEKSGLSSRDTSIPRAIYNDTSGPHFKAVRCFHFEKSVHWVPFWDTYSKRH